MTFRRDPISWLLIAVATGCFVVGGFPEWSERVDPATGDKFNELQFGFWFSPAYEHVQRRYEHADAWNDERGVGQSKSFGWETRSHFNWLSWSMLAVAIGLASLMMLNWRRQALAVYQANQTEVQSKQ